MSLTTLTVTPFTHYYNTLQNRRLVIHDPRNSQGGAMYVIRQDKPQYDKLDSQVTFAILYNMYEEKHLLHVLRPSGWLGAQGRGVPQLIIHKCHAALSEDAS